MRMIVWRLWLPIPGPLWVSCIQLVTTEIYKTKHDLNPKFMGEIFVDKNIPYNLRG